MDDLRGLYTGLYTGNMLGEKMDKLVFDKNGITHAIAKPPFVVIPVRHLDDETHLLVRNHMQERSPILMTQNPHWGKINPGKWNEFRTKYDMEIAHDSPQWEMPDLLDLQSYGVFGAAVVRDKAGTFYWLHIWGFHLECPGAHNPDYAKYNDAGDNDAKMELYQNVISANADILYLSLMRMISMPEGERCKHNHVHLAGLGLGHYLNLAGGGEKQKQDFRDIYYDNMTAALQGGLQLLV